MRSPWDERYGTDEYVYGTEPNDFLRQVAPRIPLGPVLCLAEGEGRNAVHLAERGHAVTAVDQSAPGLAKAQRLATMRGVDIEAVRADLADYEIEPGAWSGIVAIFMHLPPEVRAEVLGRAVRGLTPGGVLVLEAYTPAQLAHGTGGPPSAELMMTLDGLKAELSGLELEHAVELEREIHEGRLHDGPSAVVQVLGVRPG